jgi:DNA (cytosine-5)-methyltransferase 1
MSTGSKKMLIKDLIVRKLTPCECLKLMGFTEEDYSKIKLAGVSDTQIFKQAGNSICVPVIEGILKELLQNGELN